MPVIAPLEEAEKGIKNIETVIKDLEDKEKNGCIDDKTFFQAFAWDTQTGEDAAGSRMDGLNEEGKDLLGFDFEGKKDGKRKDEQDCGWDSQFQSPTPIASDEPS